MNMKNLTLQFIRTMPRAQRGVATLLITLVILTTITFVLIYSSRTVLTEQQITANDLRGRQAFEAAEAGMETAVAYIISNGGRDKDADNVIDPVFDQVDGVGSSNTAILENGSRVTVTMTDASQGEFVATQILSQGWSDDETATRTITQVFAYVSPLPNVPDNPLLTRGAIVISGSATVKNPEGHSTIWTGGPMTVPTGSVSTEIADPSQTADGAHTSKYPDCIGASTMRPLQCLPASEPCPCATYESTTKTVAGLDVIEQDHTLKNLVADDFFLNFFGMTKADYRQSRVTLETTADNSVEDYSVGANLAQGQVIWVDATAGTANWNGITVGCSEKGSSTAAGMSCGGKLTPSIVIVDGNLDVKGTVTIWGLLYVTGTVSGAGSVDIMGAVLMENPNSQLSGGVTIYYNSAVLRSLTEIGQAGGGGGSWRDF